MCISSAFQGLSTARIAGRLDITKRSSWVTFSWQGLQRQSVTWSGWHQTLPVVCLSFWPFLHRHFYWLCFNNRSAAVGYLHGPLYFSTPCHLAPWFYVTLSSFSLLSAPLLWTSNSITPETSLVNSQVSPHRPKRQLFSSEPALTAFHPINCPGTKSQTFAFFSHFFFSHTMYNPSFPARNKFRIWLRLLSSTICAPCKPPPRFAEILTSWPIFPLAPVPLRRQMRNNLLTDTFWAHARQYS